MFLITKTALGFGALTTNIDNFTGTSANDTFSGVTGTTTTSTLNTGDVLNGGGGTNTFNITGNGDPANAADIPLVQTTNIQNVFVRSVKNTTIDQELMEGVVNVASNGSNANLTVNNADLASRYWVIDSAKGTDVTLTADFANAAGDTDTALLAVQNAGSKVGTSTSRATITLSNDSVEAVEMNAVGTNYVTLNAGTGAASIEVSGAATNNININTAAASKLAVDLSGTTGTNTVALAAGLLNGTTTVTGGTGADTLSVDINSASQITPTISGVESLSLLFSANGTLNASKVTDVTAIDVSGGTATGTGTLISLAAEASTFTTDETNAGNLSVRYVTGANTDVTYNIGGEDAVTSGDTSFTNIAGLTINAVGEDTSGLGALNIGAATALELTTATKDTDLTVGALTAASLATLTVNATAGDVTLSTGNDVAASKLTSIDLTATGGADLDVLGGQDFTSAALLETISVNVGDESTVTLGGALAAKALQSITIVAGNDSTITAGEYVVHDTDSVFTSLSVTAGTGATLTLTDQTGTPSGIFIDANGETAISSVSFDIGSLAATSTVGDIEGDSIAAVSLKVGESEAATTLTIDALKSDLVGDVDVEVGKNSTIIVTDVLELSTDGALTGSVGNITASGLGSFKINIDDATSDYQSVGFVDFSALEGGGQAIFNNNITTGTDITGGKGADTLTGTGGADVISGGDGNDGITGGAGADDLQGGAGNDTFTVTGTSNDANDLIDGGTGTNTINVTATTDFADTDANIVNIQNVTIGSGAVNVTLTGQTEAFNITGGTGANIIISGSGADTISAGNGADIIRGAEGNDSLVGGAGSDKFVFEATATLNGVDTINGFYAGATGTAAAANAGDAFNFINFFGSGNGRVANGTSSGVFTAIATNGTAGVAVADRVAIISGGAGATGIAKVDTAAEVAGLFGAASGTGAVYLAASGDAIILTTATSQKAMYVWMVNNDGTAGVTEAEVSLVGEVTLGADYTNAFVEANFVFS